MTIAPLVLAKLCQSIYSPIQDGAFDHVISNGIVTVGIKKIGEVTTLAFAGSEDFTDWQNDFAAFPFNHPQLKTIHLGFWQGVQDVFDKLKPYLSGIIAMTGHSLGCAHAGYIAALAHLSGIAVQTLTMFAPPRMSYQPLADMLKAAIPDLRAYRNSGDPVPGLPISLPFAPWIPVSDYFPLNAKPESSGLFASHSIHCYVNALSSL